MRPGLRHVANLPQGRCVLTKHTLVLAEREGFVPAEVSGHIPPHLPSPSVAVVAGATRATRRSIHPGQVEGAGGEEPAWSAQG